MRNLIFDITARSGAVVIWFLQTFSKGVAYSIGAIFGILIWVTANTTKALLVLINRRKYEHASQVIDQSTLSKELEILQAVSKVKEDAMNRALWTSDHSIALNQLGSRLYNECDWSESNIHKYMRGVVESIPGLSYAVPDSEGDDDEDGIPLD